MGPWPPHHHLIDEEDDDQQAASDQQRSNRARLQPVEAIALIEAGINHRNPGAEQQNAAPVGVPEHLPVDRFWWRPEIDHQPHQRRENHALPVQPLPSQMIDIKADHRRAGIQREPDPNGIDRDRRQPPSDRQVAKDDHQRRGDEHAQQQAVDDAERDQQIVVVRERDHQRDQGIEQARNTQNAAQAEGGGKPGHRRRDRRSASRSPPLKAMRPRRSPAKRRRADPATRPMSAGCRSWREKRRAARRRPRTGVAARRRRASAAPGR